MEKVLLYFWHKWAGEYRSLIFDTQAEAIQAARRLKDNEEADWFEIQYAVIWQQRTLAIEELQSDGDGVEATEVGHGNG